MMTTLTRAGAALAAVTVVGGGLTLHAVASGDDPASKPSSTSGTIAGRDDSRRDDGRRDGNRRDDGRLDDSRRDRVRDARDDRGVHRRLDRADDRVVRHAEPGDDHGRHAEPGDDRGSAPEVGDDNGGRSAGGDDSARDDHSGARRGDN